MEFLNPLLEEESDSMRTFLRQISSPLAEDGWIPNLALPADKSELGRHLSCLHTILSENISTMSTTKSARLRILLDGINVILHRPSIPQLEEISRPTLKTLQQVQAKIKQKILKRRRDVVGIPIPPQLVYCKLYLQGIVCFIYYLFDHLILHFELHFFSSFTMQGTAFLIEWLSPGHYLTRCGL